MSSTYQRRNRPRNQSVRLVVDVPPEVIIEIDRWGVPAGRHSRSDAVREIIRQGLSAVRSLDEKIG